ncbi:VWA domain-containing protein [Arthrobacter psychrochitiniphilus]|uniref:Uncharacterized protein n=1 Tax=Arthrobacter psychrochitiniphilus TaxID=291045 RepID=A0A2V3DRT0_9MICC|nr:VWA domain-containing protein [Arthrobacter psychrochitiniphilus]NYG19149.1 hypothetical protein [Arthrobacter psychrochitiniphilus]PXA65897.1 hypothetical protein CVS29_07720 [Arthrobacter psychrochitiniphilus]
MPTYMLEGAAEVKLNVRPLRFILRLEGPGVQGWLEISQDSRAVQNVMRPPSADSMVILPQVAGATMVSLLPVGMERFPAPTIAHLSIVVEDKVTADPQRVVLAPVDVSGLDRKDLIFISPGEGALSVRAAHNQADADLGALGNAARVATREILGLQWVEPALSVNMVVAVDGSGSTVDLVQEGTIATVAQVIAGISQVVSNGRDVNAAIVDESFHLLPPADLAQLPALINEHFKNRIPSSGFRSTSRLDSHYGLPAQQLVYLLTDGLPADAEELPRYGSGEEIRHIVAVGDPAAWQLLGGSHAPNTLIEAPIQGESVSDRLLRDPRALSAVVASLLQACFPAGSDLSGKVNR